MSTEMDVSNPTSILPSSTNEGQKAQSEAASFKMKRKAFRPSSVVWSHFTRFVIEEGYIKAKCNYCPKDFFADPKKNGTTSMKSHMGVCKNRVNASSDPSQAELVFESGGDASLSTWKFNQDVIRKGIAEMIILDELPFRFVEGKGFRKCMALACPRFHVPSRWTVARDCYPISSFEMYCTYS